MSTLEQRQADAVKKMNEANPANQAGKRAPGERKRIPMTLPQLKLSVPEIPGYNLHWFRGTPDRIGQAQQAGYEFVAPEEIDLNAIQLGGDVSNSGNTDLGSRVSIIEGSEVDGRGQAVRLYLMKQKMEYFLEDRKILNERNEGVAEALTASYRRGTVGGQAQGERPEDLGARYVDRSRTKIPALFQKKGK